MRPSLRIAVLAGLAAVTVPVAAVAAPIEYRFTGTIATVAGNPLVVSPHLGEVEVGDAFSGRFRYHFDPPPGDEGGAPGTGVYGSGEHLTIEYVVRFEGTQVRPSSGSAVYMLVSDGSLELLDLLPATTVRETCDEFQLGLQFEQRIFGSGHLPPTLDLSSLMEGSVIADWFVGEPGTEETDYFSVYGHIDSMNAVDPDPPGGTAVSEPASVLLLGLGLFVMKAAIARRPGR